MHIKRPFHTYTDGFMILYIKKQRLTSKYKGVFLNFTLIS